MEGTELLAPAHLPPETPAGHFAPPLPNGDVDVAVKEEKDTMYNFGFGDQGQQLDTIVKQPDDPMSAMELPAPLNTELSEAVAKMSVEPHWNPDLLEAAPIDLTNGNMDDLANYEAEEAAVPVPQDAPMQAFAKLQFPDGDFYVNTLAIEIGRDMNAEKHQRRQARNEKRSKVKQDGKEQEQGIADGNQADASLSSQSKPKEIYAMSCSNVSETGGIVGVNVYSDSDDSNSRKRKRKHLLSTASSQSQSQSVAPSKLHNNDPSFTTSLFDREGSARSDASGDYAGDIGDCPLLPIHPQGLHSIKSISKVHVRVEFNPGKGFWEMHVKGKNGAWHDNDHLSKGAVQKLQHGSVIQIVDLPIIFKLPDNARGEGEVGEEEEYLSDSPLSDIGSSPEPERRRKVKADDSSSGSDEDQPLRIKIKKKPKKRHIVKLKLPKRTESLESTPAVAPERPSTSSKQPAKTVQPPQTPIKPDPATATAPVTTTEQAPDQQRRPSEITTPVTPAAAIETGALSQLAESVTPSAVPAADLPPGSILAGLAPEEIPQKRKGPGRPPKNGVMSKRDEAIIKRKKKELQKLGKEIPPLTELLAMARAEAGTKKDTKPEDGKEEDQAKQSIEIDPLLMAQNPSGTPNGEIRTDANGQQQSQSVERTDTKPKRIAKSPSPQKPESEYTEEELKKPTATYVVLIHEAISKSPTGIMDLQQIYDAMQKMYPWFKYRSQTHGWQSSVRHNLISSEAFEEAGKIGKGRLWKINPNVSIDKEKKRKAPTPPPDSRPTYQYPYTNGQYPYGANPPPSSYGQPYRPSPYGTPYGQPSALPNGIRPPGGPPPAKPGAYYSPYASNPQGGATHASPYGPPSRPPYGAPGHFATPPAVPPGQPPANGTPGARPPSTQSPHPPPPNGAQPPRPPQPPQPGQAAAGQPQPPRQQSGTPQPPHGQPTPSAQPQQQDGLGSEKTIDAIMDYHKRFVTSFKPGKEQDDARNLFRKAVARHIDHSKDHGPFSNGEEEKIWKHVGDIMKAGGAHSPAPQGPPQAAGGPPVQQHGQAQNAAPSPAVPTVNGVPAPPMPGAPITGLANTHAPPGPPGPHNAHIYTPASIPSAQQPSGQPQPAAGSQPERDLVQALQTATTKAPSVAMSTSSPAPPGYAPAAAIPMQPRPPPVVIDLDPPTAPAPAPAPVPPAPVSAPMPPTQAPAPAPPAPAPVAPIAGPASSQTPAPVPAPASVAVPVSSPAPAPAPAPAAPAQTPAGLTPIPAPATGASQPASASISAAPAAAGTKRALSPDSDGGDADEAKKQKVEGNA